MVGWSITAGAQAFLSNRAAYYAIKALLGLLMGGFIPLSLPTSHTHIIHICIPDNIRSFIFSILMEYP